MKRISTLIFFFFVYLITFSQFPSPNSYSIMLIPGIDPVYEGCDEGTEEEGYSCSIEKLFQVMQEEMECPWRDLRGEYARVVIRFFVNENGELERFHTLYSKHSANRDTRALNMALIKAINATNGNWTPARQGMQTLSKTFIVPLECACKDDQPELTLLDTIPAYYQDGSIQLDYFIHEHIEFPPGFLSKSGRKTTVLLKAVINEKGMIDSSSIRVRNLNFVDYRLAENAISILQKLAATPWEPARIRSENKAIPYTHEFAVTYHDDRNPRRGEEPIEWEKWYGNSSYFNNGVVEYNEGNYAEAINYFQKALFLDPDDGEAWLELGRAYMAQYNKEKAIEALEKAMALEQKEAEKLASQARNLEKQE